MNKLLLSLLCVFVISCGLSCVCACEDMGNATVSHDFLQNDVQKLIAEDIDVAVDENSTSSQTLNVAADDNTTVQINETQLNGTSNVTVNETTYKLNITGPKITNYNVSISGPKLNVKVLPVVPKLSEREAILLFCTHICKAHPDFTLCEIINAFGMKYANLATKVIPEAYAKALKVKGSEMRYPNGITERDVLNFMMEHDDLLYPDEY